MPYKFEQLEVWKLALDYIDLIYKLAENLPRSEDFNLKSQITRAATSIALNIAEGSQGQSDAEQARFLGMSLRSLIETVACQKSLAEEVISRMKSCSIKPTRIPRRWPENCNLFGNLYPPHIRSKRIHLYMQKAMCETYVYCPWSIVI